MRCGPARVLDCIITKIPATKAGLFNITQHKNFSYPAIFIGVEILHDLEASIFAACHYCSIQFIIECLLYFKADLDLADTHFSVVLQNNRTLTRHSLIADRVTSGTGAVSTN